MAMTRQGPDPIDVAVGARVRIRRRWLGFSQTQLATALGITFQQVQKYERGANRVSASMLVKIAAKLETTGRRPWWVKTARLRSRRSSTLSWRRQGRRICWRPSPRSRMANRAAPCSPSPKASCRPARLAPPPKPLSHADLAVEKRRLRFQLSADCSNSSAAFSEGLHVGRAIRAAGLQRERHFARPRYREAGVTGRIAVTVPRWACRAGLRKAPSRAAQVLAHGAGQQDRIRLAGGTHARDIFAAQPQQGHPRLGGVDHPAAEEIGGRARHREQRRRDRGRRPRTLATATVCLRAFSSAASASARAARGRRHGLSPGWCAGSDVRLLFGSGSERTSNPKSVHRRTSESGHWRSARRAYSQGSDMASRSFFALGAILLLGN